MCICHYLIDLDPCLRKVGKDERGIFRTPSPKSRLSLARLGLDYLKEIAERLSQSFFVYPVQIQQPIPKMSKLDVHPDLGEAF